MPPEIMKTVLLDEWVIVTRKTQREGFAVAHAGKKYPIPQSTIDQIVYDYLVKGLEGMENGYTFEFTKDKEVFKVTVERL